MGHQLRARAISLRPVCDLHVSDNGYANSSIMACYLPGTRCQSAECSGEMVSWRLELDEPDLPGERFDLLLEGLYGKPMQEVSFSHDLTTVTMRSRIPDSLDSLASAQGHRDYLEVLTRMHNLLWFPLIWMWQMRATIQFEHSRRSRSSFWD